MHGVCLRVRVCFFHAQLIEQVALFLWLIAIIYSSMV